MLVRELEPSDETKGLIDRSTNCSIVNLDGPDLLVTVDDEQASESSSVKLILLAGDEDTIIPGHVFADISKEWVIDLAKTAFGSWCLQPSQMGEMRIGGDAQNFSSKIFELLDAVGEGDELGWADVGEVEGVEDEDHVFPFVVVEVHRLELVVDDGVHALELGCGGSWIWQSFGN